MAERALWAEIPMPPQIARLPRDHVGHPVPWFVAWIDGKPDFRVIAPGKVQDAIRYELCWVCGQHRGRNQAFVIGPMCAVNRTTAEPGGHRDCAIYAARACPFLATPNMRRRETGIPEEAAAPAGQMIRRNPGVALVWVTRDWALWRPEPDGGLLYDLGDPTEVLWYAHGRAAGRAEVWESIESGLPILRQIAEDEGPEALIALSAQVARALPLLPAEAVTSHG